MKLVVQTILSFLGDILRAYVASVLWGWFIVPAFGLPTITTLTWWGIIAIRKLTWSDISREDLRESTDEERWLTAIIWLIASPLLLAAAWLTTKVLS